MADIPRSVFTIILGIIPFTLVLCWSSSNKWGFLTCFRVRIFPTCLHLLPYPQAAKCLGKPEEKSWWAVFPGFLSCQTSPHLAFKNLSKFLFWMAVLVAATSCALLEVEQFVCPACSWRSFLPFAVHVTCLHCDFSSQSLGFCRFFSCFSLLVWQ